MAKVYLWGDSIGQGVVFNEERHRYCLAKERCANLLKQAGEDMDNHARMGATIRDGYEDFCKTETEPDSVLAIEFGGNDCDLNWDEVATEPNIQQEGKISLKDFKELLGKFIADGRARRMKPLLVTPIPLSARRFYDWVSQGRDKEAILRYLGDVEHIYRWQERYARAVAEASYEYHCPLVDLRSVFLEQPHFEDMMCVDGMHPNEHGQQLMAGAILAKISDYREQLDGETEAG